MICLNCGFCCVKYDVIIVSPTVSYNPNLILRELDIKYFIHKPCDKICPHLYLDNNIYKCKLHEYNWYKETPCHDYSQVEYNKNCFCRTGKGIRDKIINFKVESYPILEVI